MAAIFVLAGGIVGFLSAVLSVLMIGSGLLAALGIWTTVGLLFLLLGLWLASTTPIAKADQAISATHPRPQGTS